MKIQELLDCEDKWTQGDEAIDKKEKSVPPNSPEAVKWCLVGAILKCYPLSRVFEIRDKIKNITKIDVERFNDSHSYEEIMKVVRKLDI